MHTRKNILRYCYSYSQDDILEDIYELYIQRKQGIKVSKQAATITKNQVYWYRIFNDMEL